MNTILILLVLKLGSIGGVYLGEFKNPAECAKAAEEAAPVIAQSGVLQDVDAATLLCVPKNEV